jgi:hypothetical protein
VHRDPSPDAHADRADLRFTGRRIDPDADPSVDRPRRNIQLGKCIDQPVFQRMNENTDIATAFFEIELDIADALSRAVIGVSPAAPGAVNRKTRIEQFVR